MSKYNQLIDAVFVATRNQLSPIPGGQQLATQEFILVLSEAGFSLTFCVYESANRLKDKIFRRIYPYPYRHYVPSNLTELILAECDKKNSNIVFLDDVNLAPVASKLKLLRPELRIVLISFGLTSVDYLHELRVQNWGLDFSGLHRSQTLRLGRQIIEECRHRQYIDAIMCLAPFEAEIERWLGARKVLVVPRMVTSNPLVWNPVQGRVGFVGRLDHPPNLEGLRRILDSLQFLEPVGFEFRIIGSPTYIGKILAGKYGFVTYLGELSDAELRDEACTWSCTMNPLFCYAHGASTKLAVIMSWVIPVISTPEGMRGYEWREGSPVIASTPDEFVQAILDLAFLEGNRNAARQDLAMVIASSITMKEISGRIKQFLEFPSKVHRQE